MTSDYCVIITCADFLKRPQVVFVKVTDKEIGKFKENTVFKTAKEAKEWREHISMVKNNVMEPEKVGQASLHVRSRPMKSLYFLIEFQKTLAKIFAFVAK